MSSEKVRQFFAGGTSISGNDSAIPTRCVEKFPGSFPTRPFFEYPAFRYLNDFDFLPDGCLVISESSTKFDDRDFIYDLMEHRANGR